MRAAAENVLGGATEHATRKANGVGGALEMSKWVHGGELSRSIGRSRLLVAMHSLLGGRSDGTSEA